MDNKFVQDYLEVEDDEVIAYGYTFERDTVEVFFRKGFLVRRDIPQDKTKEIETINSSDFDGNLIHLRIKRYYRDRTRAKLVDFFEAVGHPLPITG